MDFRTHLNALIFLLVIFVCSIDAKFTCKSFRCKRNNEANSRRFFSQRDFPPDNIMSRRAPSDFSFTHFNLKYPLNHSITRKKLCFLAHPNSKILRRHIPQVMTFRLRRPRELYMAMDVKIRIVGKKNGGEKWINDAYDVYAKRIGPSSGLALQTVWHKSNDDLIKGVETDKLKGHSIILLDPLGVKCSSEIFSSNMYKWLERGGSRVSFVIGGADGLPPSLRGSSPGMSLDNKQFIFLSLSDLTFTHQFARVLLVEQVYRASEIRRGSGYHK